MAKAVVVGGGFSGVATAVNLAAAASEPLAITIVEPGELGRGVAYGTDDPDHRLNGPSVVHFLRLDEHDSFSRWHTTSGAAERDPQSVQSNGVFPRRQDFGTYLGAQIRAVAGSNRSGSSISHCRDRVVGIDVSNTGVRVRLNESPDLDADLAVVTTSNGPPAILPVLRDLSGDPAFVGDPWAQGSLDRLPAEGRVLMIGTGLTMADLLVTLRRDRPNLTITALSRRGLLPRSLPQVARPGVDIIDILTTSAPAFIDRHPDLLTTRSIIRAVRAEISAAAETGDEWHAAFDDLRDAAHVLWPRLPPSEQARFMRHLAVWYEVHRFRYPPPTELVVREALDSGALTVEAARVVQARRTDDGIEVTRRRRTTGSEVTEQFAAVINCTGPERNPRRANDPLLGALVESGTVVPNELGLGIQVDERSSVIDSAGHAQPRLRVVGPLARGRFGECMGVPHIVVRLTNALPSMLETLQT